MLRITRSHRGASSAEVAIITAFVSCVAFLAISPLGLNIHATLQYSTEEMSAQNGNRFNRTSSGTNRRNVQESLVNSEMGGELRTGCITCVVDSGPGGSNPRFAGVTTQGTSRTIEKRPKNTKSPNDDSQGEFIIR